MKNFINIILLIIVIAFLVFIVYTQVTYNNEDKAIRRFVEDNIEKSENEIDNVIQNNSLEDNDNIEDNNYEENNENLTLNENNTSEKKVSFNSKKIKIGANGIYTLASKDNLEIDSIGINVTIKNGKAYITTDFSGDNAKFLFKDCKEVKNQEITGFKTNPTMCFLAFAGQDITAPTLCFLMEDGTVEYVKSLEMLESEKYKSNGKISELKNIVSFEYVSVSDPDGLGGYISTVAIDNDGYSYDIFEIL